MLRCKKIFLRNVPLTRRLTTAFQQKNADSEYSEVAEYPPIRESSILIKNARKAKRWHEKIKEIETIEEKLIEINIPRYYGYKCLMLDDKIFPYNSLPFLKYATNTEFVEEKSHVPTTEEEAKKIEDLVNMVRSEVQDAFEFELDGYKKSFDIKSSEVEKSVIKRAKTSGIVKQINRILVNALGADNSHLLESDADVDPRHEAFWMVGGIEPSERVQLIRKGIEWYKEHAENPVDRPFQYIGKPLLALRHQFPLQPFEEIDFESMQSTNEKIPSVTIDPRALGFMTDHRHGTTTPGFWPGNVREHGLISYQDRNFLSLKKYGVEDRQEALHSQAIVSSYAWTFAQACFHGFSTYNDMDFPLAAQTVITDGQLWSFYKYQLNTTCIHTNKIPDVNYRYNKCWGTNEMKLYDEVDDKGKLQGLNDEVLKNLLTFYVNKPAARDYNMKPLLGAKEKKIADLEDVKQRDWLEKTFKHIMSNRPRHRLTPEVYNWEKIYKIDHNTRPLNRKLRFFELGINPFRRRLNEHQPKYIPRHKRARGIHDKKIWEPTYYPLDHRMNIPKEMSHSSFGAPRDKHAYYMDRKRKSYK